MKLTSKTALTPLKIQLEGKQTRVKAHRKGEDKLALEEAWESFALIRLRKDADLTYSWLFEHKTLINLIQNTAKGFYRAWKNSSRLSVADFTSVLYEKAWTVIENYSPHGEWYLYEHLNMGFKHACIDLLRQQGLVKGNQNKHTIFHKASSITMKSKADKEFVAPINVEAEAVTNVWIQQTLEADEKVVAEMLLTDTNTNSTDVCIALPHMKYRQQATRVMHSVKMKFTNA